MAYSMFSIGTFANKVLLGLYMLCYRGQGIGIGIGVADLQQEENSNEFQ